MSFNLKFHRPAAICMGVWLLLLSTAAGDELSLAVRSAIAEAGPSVVRIRTIGTPGDSNLSVSSTITTGVVISNDREILTSVFGFTSKPAAVFVEDSNGERVAAQIVATDHLKKLVLLKCTEGVFRPVTPAKERWPAVGAWTVALGRLFPSSQPAASVGIVSAVNRIHGLAIQTDAKISPVNYGGPLVGLDGHVMGVLVPLSPSDSGDQIRAGVQWYDSGIGFAIPILDALKTAEQLRSGQDRIRGIMGIQPSTRNPLQTEVSVDFVFPKSPAAAAGIQKEDRLVAVNGVPITRFGVFDSVIKSSYAGDKMELTVKRGDKEVTTELTLAEKIERPKRGFLGIIIGRADGKSDEDEKGVSVGVLPGSPAAAAGLPETAILTRWNDDLLSSADDLQAKLRSLIADADTGLTFRLSPDATAEQTVTATPTVRSPDLLLPSDSVMKLASGGSEEMKWTRQERTLGDNGKVWFYAPDAPPDHSSGLVVLLSEAESPHEAVLTVWRNVCERYNLVLLVPSNAEGTSLTREDAGLLPQALAAAIPGRDIEIGRSILVAGEPQKELCSDLLFDPRQVQVRAAAFVNTWPGIAGVSARLLAAKSPSVLLLNKKDESRPIRALRESSVSRMTDAGIWVVQLPATDDGRVSPEEQLAIWTLNLRAR